ncbi:MAG: hypothetical protein R3194_14305, partial [Limnobacter sp.]|nr:hypothetical protein [Limnobacter sp.]
GRRLSLGPEWLAVEANEHLQSGFFYLLDHFIRFPPIVTALFVGFNVTPGKPCLTQPKPISLIRLKSRAVTSGRHHINAWTPY